MGDAALPTTIAFRPARQGAIGPRLDLHQRRERRDLFKINADNKIGCAREMPMPDDETACRCGGPPGSCSGTCSNDTDLVTSLVRTPSSRRDFIKGVIASGSTVAAMGYLFRTTLGPTPALAAPGTVERLMSLKVNGQLRRVDVLPNETLAHTLRYKLGLTGTKLGCDRGECGACTVMLDGVTHYSCTTLTHSVAGREVTTVEGIAGPDGKLHPVQQAFIDELAPQCGFCTPGQVVAAVALLRVTPKPTLDQAKLAMSGNLCRCGAYEYYLKGVMRAAGEA
jgi:aerobic-type carbon monoxide dehydrogenase small subunit (CoxS/CutS family)